MVHEVADGAAHDRHNLPVALAGGGLTHGRHVAFGAEHNTPRCNFFLSMLPDMRLEIDAFGTSTGTLG